MDFYLNAARLVSIFSIIICILFLIIFVYLKVRLKNKLSKNYRVNKALNISITLISLPIVIALIFLLLSLTPLSGISYTYFVDSESSPCVAPNELDWVACVIPPTEKNVSYIPLIGYGIIPILTLSAVTYSTLTIVKNKVSVAS